jgi:valyl-tRNA synthetase
MTSYAPSLPRRTNNTWSKSRGSRRWKKNLKLRRSSGRSKRRGSKPGTKVRELKQKLECNDFELEADHNLIEKLHDDKRELQEKIDTLAEDLQDYKRLLKENGFNVEEEEVAMEE